MSKAQHTPGPWSRNGNRIHGESGSLVATIAYFREASIEIGNARRIVACVNACEGISTEALEAGVVKELREALEGIEKFLDSFTDSCGSEYTGPYLSLDGQIAVDRVRTTIAKAKGA